MVGLIPTNSGLFASLASMHIAYASTYNEPLIYLASHLTSDDSQAPPFYDESPSTNLKEQPLTLCVKGHYAEEL